MIQTLSTVIQILVWVLLQDISHLIRLSPRMVPCTYFIIYQFCFTCYKVDYQGSYMLIIDISVWTLTPRYEAYKLGHFRVPPGLCFDLFQNEVRCSAFDIEISFHCHVNKTHFHKKGCAPSLILKVRVFRTRKWPIVVLEV